MAIIIPFPQRPGAEREKPNRQDAVYERILQALREAVQEEVERRKKASLTGPKAVDPHTSGGNDRQQSEHNGAHSKRQEENLR